MNHPQALEPMTREEAIELVRGHVSDNYATRAERDRALAAIEALAASPTLPDTVVGILRAVDRPRFTGVGVAGMTTSVPTEAWGAFAHAWADWANEGKPGLPGAEVHVSAGGLPQAETMRDAEDRTAAEGEAEQVPSVGGAGPAVHRDYALLEFLGVEGWDGGGLCCGRFRWRARLRGDAVLACKTCGAHRPMPPPGMTVHDEAPAKRTNPIPSTADLDAAETQGWKDAPAVPDAFDPSQPCTECGRDYLDHWFRAGKVMRCPKDEP